MVLGKNLYCNQVVALYKVHLTHDLTNYDLTEFMIYETKASSLKFLYHTNSLFKEMKISKIFDIANFFD